MHVYISIQKTSTATLNRINHFLNITRQYDISFSGAYYRITTDAEETSVSIDSEQTVLANHLLNAIKAIIVDKRSYCLTLEETIVSDSTVSIAAIIYAIYMQSQSDAFFQLVRETVSIVMQRDTVKKFNFSDNSSLLLKLKNNTLYY